MANTLNLSLDGMHCGACVRRVTTALQSLQGVQVDSVEVGSAHVSYNPGQTTPSQIVEAIDNIGFPTRISE
jgi:copper chaperone CopZ